jgi:hypothetical protein
MNKNILIITPFFAPETHAAVFRAHKLVKYLKRYGWNPIVLTVDTNYTYNEDPDLLKELEDIPIYRARYIEPSLRGLRMWSTGDDRTYKTLKKNGYYNNENNSSDKIQTTSKKTDVYSYILKNYLNIPDRFWTWKRSAIGKAKELIKKYDISVIYTTCLPFTCNSIGISLRKSMNIKWIADFRDPITYAKRMYSDNYSIFIKQKKIQDETFKHADHITVLSSAYELIFHDQYEGLYSNKITFIPTGLDDDYLPNNAIDKRGNYLVFIGEYLKEYKDHFVVMLKNTIELSENISGNFHIKIIGNTSINKNILMPFLRKYKLEKYFEFIDHLPQKELYLYIRQARYALLLSGEKTLWWTNFAKLVDYIALEKKVLAMIPDISEAKSQLNKAGLGIFLSNDMNSVEILKSIIEGKDIELSVDSDYCKKYLASMQVKSFIQIFENYVGK